MAESEGEKIVSHWDLKYFGQKFAGEVLDVFFNQCGAYATLTKDGVKIQFDGAYSDIEILIAWQGKRKEHDDVSILLPNDVDIIKELQKMIREECEDRCIEFPIPDDVTQKEWIGE